MKTSTGTTNTGQWHKFPLHCYQQIWSQLTLHETALCGKVMSPTIAEEKLFIIVSYSLYKEFLTITHDKTGHQGTDRTLSQLSQIAYWVGMSKDVIPYCTVCQYTKSLPPPASLQPVNASRPWELVAVDILKVPMISQGNQCILVAQDYFLKWPFAQAIPNQKAERIIKILRDQVFTLVGPPEKLHSDQGQNFESNILADLCKSF